MSELAVVLGGALVLAGIRNFSRYDDYIQTYQMPLTVMYIEAFLPMAFGILFIFVGSEGL